MPLPIYNQKDDIMSSIFSSAVTIITAETGSGKSTQIPQWILEAGSSCLVTQPRRLAARSVAARVAEEVGCHLGETVGFRTAYEACDSEKTKCLFVTDGLALVRQLMDASQNQKILVIDEVHEWNLNIEVLLSWAKVQIAQDAKFKLVLMSATLDSAALSAYFGGAKVIDVQGKVYPVQTQERGFSISDDVADLLKKGKNVLVFQPGKSEIQETITSLESKKIDAVILPLHGELTAEDQDKVFKNYALPKCIVATNVAQTSITIDDIDAVVDSGLERRVEVEDGIEGLYLRSISKADAQQRKGRAGRCREGVYIDHCRASNRRDFPLAEIERVNLDQLFLRLTIAGFDPLKMKFFHQPSAEALEAAKAKLIALACLDDSGNVTAIGKKVNKLPLSIAAARMMIEAEELRCVPEMQLLVAVLEQGRLHGACATCSKNSSRCSCWKSLVKTEQDSDVLAQGKLFLLGLEMSKEEKRTAGIHVRSWYQAFDRLRLLQRKLGKKIEIEELDLDGKKKDLITCIIAGMKTEIRRVDTSDDTMKKEGDYWRRKSFDSVVYLDSKEAVCQPWDLETKTGKTLRLANMITKVPVAEVSSDAS